LQNLPPGIAAAQPTAIVSGTCPFPRIGTSFATSQGMRGIGKRFVYILRSDADPAHHYIGATSDVGNRLEWQNHGPCGHTMDHRPWSLVVVVEFPTEQQALCFERYLKSGSGRAFARRHFSRGQERG
jgi:predicted GIY-YIG superfamily endonuclease